MNKSHNGQDLNVNMNEVFKLSSKVLAVLLLNCKFDNRTLFEKGFAKPCVVEELTKREDIFGFGGAKRSTVEPASNPVQSDVF